MRSNGTIPDYRRQRAMNKYVVMIEDQELFLCCAHDEYEAMSMAWDKYPDGHVRKVYLLTLCLDRT